MKKHPALRSLALLAATVSTLAFTACSKSERTEIADKTKDAYHDTKAAVVRGWNEVKAYSFEKRSDFELALKAQQADLEAGVSKLRSEYSEAKASASRKAAMEELKSSEADYKAKLSALGSATSATWDAARDDVVAAWDRLQASYAKARAD